MRNLISTIKKTVINYMIAGKRSDKWPEVRKAHLEKEGWCRYCGGVENLEVHHKQPFHLDPSRELDDSNLITLCENMSKECHLKEGHLGNWKSFNPDIDKIAQAKSPEQNK